MKFNAAGAICAILALSAPVALRAAPDVLQGLTDEEVSQRTASTTARLAGDPRAACQLEPLLREQDRRHPAVALRARAEYMAARCAQVDGNGPVAFAHLANAEALLPISMHDPLRPALEALGFDLAWTIGSADTYVVHFRHVVEADDPRQFAAIDAERAAMALRSADRPVGDAAYVALARAKNFAAFPDYFKQAMGELALRPLLAVGDKAIARRMIDTVSDGDHVQPLPVLRIYEPVWPEIEARLGSHMTKALADYVAIAKAEYAEDPHNRWAFDDAVRALVYAGRNREAIALAETLPRDPVTLAQIELPDAWALNAEAAALDRLGRIAEADRIFDLIAAGSPNDRPWQVRFEMLAAERLAELGRWDDALPKSQKAFDDAQALGAARDKVSAAATLLCVTAHTGADVIREPVALELVAKAGPEAAQLAAVAYLCRGDSANARKVLLAGFTADLDTQASLVIAVQPDPAYQLYVPARKAMPDISAFVLGNADLRAAFGKVGRMMPPELYRPVDADGPAPG